MKTLGNIILRGLALAALATLGCGSDDDSSPSSENAGSGGSGNAAGTQGSAGKGGGTGKGGSSNTGGDTGAAGEAACTGTDCVECKLEGDDCEPGSDECCEGACIESETGELSGCRSLCEEAGDCDSGCCQQFSNASGGFCVDADYCTCVEQDGACGPSVASNCCDGSTCAITDASYSCHQVCTASDECAEECCIPLPDTDFSICAPGEFCL
jgi:hypothetical protein